MKFLLPSFFLAALVTLVPAPVVMAQTGEWRVYDRVEVRGAVLIPPQDIQQTCGDPEGVAIDAIEMRAIRDCLMSTGIFDAVAVHPEGEVLVIEVEEPETRPGRIDFSLGWATDLGAMGMLAYDQLNLIPGTYLSGNLTYSRDYRSVGMHLFGQEEFAPGLTFGLGVEGERARHDDLDFSTRYALAEVWLRWSLRENLALEGGIGYRDQRLFEVRPGASPLLFAEAGAVSAAFVHLAVSHQSGEAGQGLRTTLRFDQYFWNLGTDRRLAETQMEFRAEQPVTAKTTLLFGLRGGAVSGQGGHRAGAADRYFPGGEFFRGFSARGIGPVHLGSHLGANRYLIGSLEVQREIGGFGAQKFRGGIFMDVGAVWGLDNQLGGAIDAGSVSKLRGSIGLSLNFEIGKVPVSLFVATPVKDRPGDRRQAFGLTASARF